MGSVVVAAVTVALLLLLLSTQWLHNNSEALLTPQKYSKPKTESGFNPESKSRKNMLELLKWLSDPEQSVYIRTDNERVLPDKLTHIRSRISTRRLVLVSIMKINSSLPSSYPKHTGSASKFL